ncbi:hypothetical protein IEQ34_021085 [Dendrobium chrysotoxum]|uniref:Uncharacterized protein n=1 Tax=Dendrobium chrysotoxum TaxID=161865 RepID=A0AAV7G4T3_DENCH|nr:hypothetical protein IEQ34_021085 [Dendrobium chrysotoxum]
MLRHLNNLIKFLSDLLPSQQLIHNSNNTHNMRKQIKREFSTLNASLPLLNLQQIYFHLVSPSQKNSIECFFFALQFSITTTIIDMDDKSLKQIKEQMPLLLDGVKGKVEGDSQRISSMG